MALVTSMRSLGPRVQHINQAGAFQSQKSSVFALVPELPLENSSDRTGLANEVGEALDLTRELEATTIFETGRERGAQLDTLVMVVSSTRTSSAAYIEGKALTREGTDHRG